MKYFNYIALCLLLFTLSNCGDDSFPVPPASTVASFSSTIDNNSFAPATASFQNESIVPAYAAPATYAWRFGDGTTSSEENPTHLYESPGWYTVTLVTSSQNQVHETSKTVVIKDPAATGLALYFSDRNSTTIQKALINTREPANEVLGGLALASPYNLLADTLTGKLYIADFELGTIITTDFDGSNAQELVSGLDGPGGLAIDHTENYLYWTTGNSVQRISLAEEGGSIEDFATGQGDDPEGIAIDGETGTVYWSTYDGGLWTKSTDGSGEAEIIPAVYGQAVAFIEGKIYYYGYDDGNYTLFSANPDGSGSSIVATGNDGDVYGIAYDAAEQKIYWNDQRSGTIWRANLDGSEKEAWFSDPDMRIYGVTIGEKVE